MIRELDSRTNAYGDRIRLLWLPRTDDVAIEIAEADSGIVRRAAVARGSALDAFRHPYVYIDAPAAVAA